MEISSQEDHDIPIPINSAYGGGHGHIIHHHHHDAAHATSAPLTHNNSNNPQMPSNGNNNSGHGHGHNYEHHQHDHDHDQDHHRHLVGYSSINYKKQVEVKYKECLKNHAASMGGNATDGCGEFMPSGEEGSIEALTCSACNCHRNFHRKEVEGELMLHQHHHPPPPPPPPQRKLILAHHPHNPHKIRSAVPHQMIMPPYMGIGVGGSHPYMPNSESEDQMDEDGGGGGLVLARPAHHQPFNQHTHRQQQPKKRFRTKFTQEQKEKMLNFAERADWKIQRQEESVVQQLCQEIGVKRRVLKVWMHNNKHNLAKKNNNGNNINLSGDNNGKNTAAGNLASTAEENM